MLLRDAAAVLRRRWYLAVVGLLLTCGVVTLATVALPSTHRTTATVVLLPPDDPDTVGDNRFLGMSGLSQAVDVLIRALNAEDLRNDLQGEPPTAEYVVTPDFTSNAPLLLVEVTSQDATAAQDLRDQILERVPKTLAQIQRRVDTPARYRIVALTLTSDRQPTEMLTPKLRLVAVLGFVTLLFSLFTVAALDGLLGRRRRSRSDGQGSLRTSAPGSTGPEEP